jgi:2-hydroxy-6-oxonona-2,4-dienedioate hydrolase
MMGRMRIAGLLGIVIAVAAAWSWVYARYQGDMRGARARVLNRSEVAQTACGPIEYATHGKGAPVLVVHGAGGGFDQGLEFAEPIVRAGFRVILMSRFGYLRTPLPPDASATAQADAHACLLDYLQIRRAAVIGVSAGAPSSMEFAVRHSPRCAALVLLVPAAYVPRPEGAVPLETPRGTRFLLETALKWDFLYWAAMSVSRAAVTRAILATPPEVVQAASQEEQQRVERMMTNILPVSERRLGLLNDALVTSKLEPFELERIVAPTLTISVKDDLFGTFDVARYTAERVPGARFLGYPTGGHLWVGHDREVTAEIVRALLRAEGLG